MSSRERVPETEAEAQRVDEAAARRVEVEQTDLAFVYDQYWEHARHAENQLWNYTRIWALILTAIVTVLGSSLPRTAKVGATAFGVLLSVLGLLLVYALRVSYVSFVFKSEVVAVNEIGLSPEYTRYIRDWTTDADADDVGEAKNLFRVPFAAPLSNLLRNVLPGTDVDGQVGAIEKDKQLDMPDVLKLAYTTVIVAGIVVVGVLLGRPLAGVGVALVAFYLIVVYDRLGQRSKERARRNVSEPLDETKLYGPPDDAE